MAKLVAYYRVSTQKQGQSGLGLEAQQAAVKAYALGHEGTILKAYTEVESGKRADRPELAKAIAHARATRATLVIAKLDRLARNVAFLSSLMESGIEFLACDNPHADRFTIHILAAVAEKEAKDISNRTIAALAAYKARGGRLGSSRPECRRNLSDAAGAKGRALAAKLRTQRAIEAASPLKPMMVELREAGLSYRAIAARLNEEGYTSSTGGPWSHIQVRLVLLRT